MDFVALVEQAGLKVINGHMRLLAALGAGVPVTACDAQGATYRITFAGDELVVEELPGKGSESAMLMVERVESVLTENLLSDPQHWTRTDIPHNLRNGSALWAIRECDLLQLMSVKIGATYVSVRDAAGRTEIAVRPVSDKVTLESPDNWDVATTPESSSVYYNLWAIRETDLLELLSFALNTEVLSVAEASKATSLLMRPVPTSD